MKKLKTIKEEIAMSVGGGMQGLGSAKGEPIAGFDPLMMGGKVLRRKPPAMFGGKPVFKVSSDAYHKAIQGKKKYKHYKTYIGDPLLTQEIRDYVKANRNAPILVQDEKTGAMVYLKHGKEKR